MTNSLNNFVRQNFELFQQLPGYVGVYNRDSRIAFCNQAHAVALGFPQWQDAMGKMYDQVKAPSCELAETLMRRDRHIIVDQAEVCFLSYAKNSANEWALYLGNKRPIYNTEKKTIGILSISNDITNKRLLDLSRYLTDTKKSSPKQTQFSYSIQDELEDDTLSLSKRQLECLYYLLRAKSMKEIAATLGLSHRTIESYVAYIKAKWQCQTTQELIQKGIHQGYLNFIPKSIFLQTQHEKSEAAS